MLFQYAKLSKCVFSAIADKPDEQAEWTNILQLMIHLRQALACTTCGELVVTPYIPIDDSCHCYCQNCHLLPDYVTTCQTCKRAFENQSKKLDGFTVYNNLTYLVDGFIKLRKVLCAKHMNSKWSTLYVTTQNAIVSFSELVSEGSEESDSSTSLGDRFRKKTKDKLREHHCRCGSSKKSTNNGTRNNTCLETRCRCYKQGKACTNCRCVGCQNKTQPQTNEPS